MPITVPTWTNPAGSSLEICAGLVSIQRSPEWLISTSSLLSGFCFTIHAKVRRAQRHLLARASRLKAMVLVVTLVGGAI